jgi:hypothetical protein
MHTGGRNKNGVCKRRGRRQAASLKPQFRLGPEASRNVAEDVLDLVAKKNEDYDDHDRDQDQNEGVLNHALTFLVLVTVHKLTELQIKI